MLRPAMARGPPCALGIRTFSRSFCTRPVVFNAHAILHRTPAVRPSIRSSNPKLLSLRHASSTGNLSPTAVTAAESRSLLTRLKNILFGTSIALSLVFGYYYITDTRASVHRWLVTPVFRWVYEDAEEAHEAGTKALKALYEFGIHPRERSGPDKAGDLSVEVFGHTISNPIGTSAGIDKHAEIPSALLALGPAIVEIGGATPYPQDGNPKPRVFRLPSQKALINRYGLNSEGADNVAMRLRQRVREFAYAVGFGIDEFAERRVLDGEAAVPPGSLVDGKLLAVQVAKNKFTPESDIEAVKRDYVYCVDALGKYADILVINVSSPNTPGLRSLQSVKPLTSILEAVVEAAQRVDRKSKPAVMVKVSPDEDSDDQITGICEAIFRSGVDGVIVGNTTKRRPEPLPEGYILPNKEAALLLEEGGYSGPQLFERTLALVKRYRLHLDGGMYRNAELPSQPEPHSQELTGGTQSENLSTRPHSKKEANKNRVPVDADKVHATTLPRDGKVVTSSDPLIQRSGLRNDTAREPVASPGSPHIPSPTTGSEVAPLDRSTARSSFSSPTESLLSGKMNKPKVIFATGGVTNGRQALEVLNAGADVAMVYTALVYGGVGTISAIKQELRDELRKKRP